jgi:hypothetical protein
MCTIYTRQEINEIYYSIISTYQVKNSPQNQQLYGKTNQNSLKIHFIKINSFIQMFTA